MIADALNEAINGVLELRLRDLKQREMVVTILMDGFANLKKKPVPDLAQRIEAVQKRVKAMSEDIGIGFINGRLVVKVKGSSESLLTELRHGSDWYDPWDKVDEVTLAAILIDPAK